jgi:hypothetical protein
MKQVLSYSRIEFADEFVPAKFPEIDSEINTIKAQLKGSGGADQSEVIISYCKDHSVRSDLALSQSALVKILRSMDACQYMEDLFSASKGNESFRRGFENYVASKFIG